MDLWYRISIFGIWNLKFGIWNSKFRILIFYILIQTWNVIDRFNIAKLIRCNFKLKRFNFKPRTPDTVHPRFRTASFEDCCWVLITWFSGLFQSNQIVLQKSAIKSKSKIVVSPKPKSNQNKWFLFFDLHNQIQIQSFAKSNPNHFSEAASFSETMACFICWRG